MKEMRVPFIESLLHTGHCARPFTNFPHLSYVKTLNSLHSHCRAENKYGSKMKQLLSQASILVTGRFGSLIQICLLVIHVYISSNM